MSRIGQQKINIPQGVEVALDKNILTVKGPKGENKRTFRDEISIQIDGSEISVNPVAKNRLARSLWGTYASHIRNMIIGVTDGYKKELEVSGVGYRAEMKGVQLQLRVGYSHPVLLDIPTGLQVSTKDNVITVEGFNKEAVGKFAAEVRQVRKPEPYKGKGIKYVGEVIRRKQGKKKA